MSENDKDIDGFFSTARVSGREEAVELGEESYRDFLLPLDHEKLAPWRGMGYEEFTAARQGNPFLQQLLDDWDALYAEPFVGITTDGVVRGDVWSLEPGGTADTALVEAAQRFLAELPAEARAKVLYPIDAPDWRGWSNPEFVFHRNGLRLEDLAEQDAQRVFDILRAAFSPEGYDRLIEAMELNGFLGELVDLPTVMNARSYWFSIFGEPSLAAPWGFQLFGHHAAINFVTVGGRDVVAPCFIGAEPALTDTRPPIFDEREKLAIELAQSFAPEQRAKAVVFESVLDPAMPEGRLHPADERHVAGAFRDNRVVPYEGIPVSEFTDGQRALLRQIVEDFHLLLTGPQRAATMEEFEAHLDETWFSWYGATDGSQPIYFRVQSPVIIAELDNHAGVWLSNTLPARFHVHSTLRLPNGNDYGKAYIQRIATPEA
ncbi:DUF3500 domain-containing protein [Salinibacterium sp. ZJ70]|uniref:DUF3500 domain-containing protein n=1 Tax=Salinibacterium sp. ZJ70 TaxID=2708084 RepID=UPI001423764A|nr:DUF3500 domain-containing protein [Salinibacterium sp. ZJ70]